MSGYTKNIAVIKGVRSGFSADGGALSGLVKTEKYGPFFRAEVSYINFAPLSGGRYVTAVSDGEHTVILDGPVFEGESEIDTSCGFAALVCFVGTDVLPIAAAVCGEYGWAAAACAGEIERAEKIKNTPPQTKYEDEAIAEENYYEYSAEHSADLKGQGALRQDKEQKNGRGPGKDEDAGGLFKESEAGKMPAPECLDENSPDRSSGESAASGGFTSYPETGNVPKENSRKKGTGGGRAKKDAPSGTSDAAKQRSKTKDGQTDFDGELSRTDPERGDLQPDGAKDGAEPIPLAADLKFYERMSGEIEKLLSSCPREEALERTVENSRWVRVSYGKDMHYVFGVINEGASPSYICYGVPGTATECPASLAGMAGFIPSGGGGGYWVMYQDARTGASIKLNTT